MPLYGYVMPLFVTITTITNSFIIVVLSQKHLRTPTNFVLLSMALVDLLTGLTSVPWFLHYYTLKGHLIDKSKGMNEFWCRIHPILSQILPTFAFLTEVPEFMGRYNMRVEFLDRSICFKYYSAWVRDVVGVHLFNSFNYWFRVLLVHFLPCVLLIIFTYKLSRTIKRSESRKRSCLSNSCDFNSTPSAAEASQSRRYSIGANAGRSLYATNRMLSTICLIPAGLIFMIHSLITLGFVVRSADGSQFMINHLYHFLNVLLIVRNLLIVLTSPMQFAIYCSMSEQFRLTVRQLFSTKLLFVAQAQATFHGGKRYSLILVDVETLEHKRNSVAVNRRSFVKRSNIHKSERSVAEKSIVELNQSRSPPLELTKLYSTDSAVPSSSVATTRTVPKVNFPEFSSE
uniref:G_PROTEIN_RECEP_F1_2 domain-containing protein n=2 Tax=Panagrellus redivivus TaxID=6233 RepID=A0A7E4VXP8_PANRE